MIIFDPESKRIILDSSSVSAVELYSRSCDWLLEDDNVKYGAVFRQVGGDELGGGLFIPPYFFLQNTWRVRPMETNHTLIITGNLFVEGGGIPVVQTLGNFNVSAQYTVPVQAQAMATEGGGGVSPALESKIDFLTAILKNKREVVKIGDVWTLVVYGENDITPILSKPVKDIDGNNIADLAAGLIAVEEKSSV